MSVILENEAKRKQEARDIVKTIIDFGVTEDQKIDIMYFLSLTLNNNEKMKNIANFLKNHKSSINIDESESSIKNKIIVE
jgi:uncharacterized 2Fe-2S/4Fe-4S cluster protein (DUF4445 family)